MSDAMDISCIVIFSGFDVLLCCVDFMYYTVC